MNKLEKIILSVATIGTLGYGMYKMQEFSSEHGEKSMHTMQPWIWIYDDNKDGMPDRTRVGFRGGPYGAIPILYDRKPTKEEKEWYLKN